MSDDTTCRLCRRKWDKHESWCSISVMRKRIEELKADLKLALELASHPTCDECREHRMGGVSRYSVHSMLRPWRN